MSRIGKLPIKIPDKVKVAVDGSTVHVEGPKGKLAVPVNPLIKVAVEGGQVIVTRPSDERLPKSLHGLTRTLLNNAVRGVTQGFEDVLEIKGVGYRAEVKGQVLNLSVGFSHPVDFVLPAGISCEVEKQTRVILRGVDKKLVGQTSAEIRRIKRTEPYKGKGIQYAGERVRRKVGKQGVA
ncbi:MAG: 50S ribosomal protein L6 [Myxococcales bacterium]|jgi:large subunit ribosomal protein L6